MEEVLRLTQKEKAFCEAYVKHYNATKAYIEAYGDNTSDYAHKEGWRVVKRPQCKAYILQLQKDAYESACITAERVAMKLAEIAFSEEDNAYYPHSAKTKALDLLQKQLGLQKQHIEADVSNEVIINIGGDNQ